MDGLKAHKRKMQLYLCAISPPCSKVKHFSRDASSQEQETSQNQLFFCDQMSAGLTILMNF